MFFLLFFYIYIFYISPPPPPPPRICVWVGGLHNKPCVSVSVCVSLSLYRSDVPSVDFMCFIFTLMPGGSCRTRFMSLVLYPCYACDVSRAMNQRCSQKAHSSLDNFMEPFINNYTNEATLIFSDLRIDTYCCPTIHMANI